jgi:ABC-type branched-subunit amino acid transport system ATPase component/branched-subunit amino acid ABC-type transport system permease component
VALAVLSDFLPFIVVGITTGAVYGLAGTGLNLTFKTSGIFNFAYGSLAAISVFVFYFLNAEHGWPWPLAAAVCILVLAPIEGLGLEVMARALEPVGATLKVVATIGIMLVVLGVGSLWYGNNTATFPQFLPQESVSLGGVNIGWDQIIVVVISVLAAGLLYYFFRFVRLGIAMRGVVDNPDLISMTGENPVRVRRWAWVIGMMFASMAGLLLAPSLSLNALIITMLVIQAFGAVAIGYFSSLPLTFAGGLFIGVVAALATKYAVSISWLTGLPAGLPYIILLVALVVTPKARLIERRVVHSLPVRRSWHAPTRMRLLAGAVVIAVLCFVPQLTGTNLPIWSDTLTNVILFLSLGILVRVSGQISLCHLAFAAVGAAAFSHFSGSYHIPWLLALALAALVAMPVGALVAIPAIRLSGVFLALATFGFGILLEQMFYTTSFMFGPTTSGIGAARPDVSLGPWNLSTDTGFYYVLLIAVVLTVVVVTAIERGRMGRLLGGLADSPVALETHGAGVNVVRVVIFCISAALASMSGALTAVLFHFSVGGNYGSFNSVVLVALVMIAVFGEPWYALIAAIGYTVVPGYVTIANINTYLEILFGFFAVVFAVRAGASPSVPRPVRDLIERLGGRRSTTAAPIPAIPAPAGTPFPAAPVAAPAFSADSGGLAISHLSVRFGGVRAVQDVTLEAPMGRITGLIGPNGAGKTTTFNACSGLVTPTAGTITLDGRDISRRGLSARSRLGLGRTFQRAALFDSLTVRENVALGREASMAGRNPLTQLVGTVQDRRTIARAVDEAIELTGIGDLAAWQAGLLPAGQRRMVELARVLAGPFHLLLLDEPSSGLDAPETHHFGDVLTGSVRERGLGILLVEHDMELVRQVCQHVYVLDFGELVFEGTTSAMLRSPVVRSAYLGAEGEEPARA